MKILKKNISGKEVEVQFEKHGKTLWIHLNGLTYSYEKISQAQKNSQISVGNPLEITAPMPGKVIKVLVAEGASFENGETLAVMEAMKMEYALKASMDGNVEKINCRVGDQVNLGQILLELSQK